MSAFEGKCEYAKTGRAGCKKCKEKIGQGSLRLARMVQSHHFDGMQPFWYHFRCFFEHKSNQLASSVQQFEGFGDLKWDDQEKFRKKFEDGGGVKTNAEKVAARPLGCPVLQMEYAKSSRSECRNCKEVITKDELRVAALFPPSDDTKFRADVPHWCHRKCFPEIIQTDFYSTVPLNILTCEHFIGHSKVKAADKKDLDQLFEAARVANDMPKILTKAGKRKAEEAVVESAAETKKAKKDNAAQKAKMKKQSEDLWQIRDALSAFTSATLKHLLASNGQDASGSQETLTARLGEAILFGALQKCPDCKNGVENWRSKVDGFLCAGDLGPHEPCGKKTLEPPRKKFVISKDVKDESAFFKKFKPVVQQKLYDPDAIALAEATEKLKEGVVATPVASASSSVKVNKSPLAKIIVALGGKLNKSNAEYKTLIKNLGMTFHAGTIGSHVTALVTTEAEFDKDSKKIKDATHFSVPIVKESFLTECLKIKGCALLQSHLIHCSGTVIEPSMEDDRRTSNTKDQAAKYSGQGSTSLVIKGRVALEIDPDDREHGSLVQTHHVLDTGGVVWSCSLTIVNTTLNKNSFYKIQILERDGAQRDYRIFKKWGRTGTKQGQCMVERFGSKSAAQGQFEVLFQEKTGNSWKNRDNFAKKAKFMNYVPQEFSAPSASLKEKLNDASTKCKLEPQVADLVSSLFDKEAMVETMQEMEIDLSKMPLGKIKRSEIEKGYVILQELESALKCNSADLQRVIKRCTNQFYSIIPHSFGNKRPPLIDDLEKVKSKVELVETLLDMECASRIIKKEEDGDKMQEDVHPLDAYYSQLNTKIQTLDKESEEFQMIETYVKNTHAKTHSSYKIVIEEVFKIKREGEKKIFAKHKSLHNKRLLWHGSRMSNFVGILSEGLRIAPPSAPVTGYMFGKGVYFADMVSKSANYCFANHRQPKGLLALSEVALGNMYECKHATYVIGHDQNPSKDQDATVDFVKLPENNHSTFGMGTTMPEVKSQKILDNGVVVPLGKAGPVKVPGSSLLYNEFIVYDKSQIHMKYLLKIHFDFGGSRW
eukprot:m.10767 g.10767  ORF g.10767 m.10767 type:complete len:1051 (-) comp8472_c0_seq1:19-3171(-)